MRSRYPTTFAYRYGLEIEGRVAPDGEVTDILVDGIGVEDQDEISMEEAESALREASRWTEDQRQRAYRRNYEEA